MSGFLPNEPTTFINIKLTDTGRRLLSLGRLTFDKAALSDREIDYGIDHTNTYSILNNRILAPKDDEPTFTNLDDSNFIPLGPSRVTSIKQLISGVTDSTGFFTGSTNAFGIEQSKYYTKLTFTYSGNGLPQGLNTIAYDSGSELPYSPNVGQLIYIPWEPIQNSGKTYDSSTILYSGNPTVGLWYRIISASTNTLYLDRPTPNFGTTASNQKINAYVYPFNGIETYYSTAYTVPVSVWNMNIVRTNSVPGTYSTLSGYTSYGSIEYNGTRAYLNFSSETRDIGIVHFTNLYTGNTYAEQLVEGSFHLTIPNIMWHKTPANNGEGMSYGIDLYDIAGDTTFDISANTTYRLLRDGSSINNTIVGRVYHKLKIAVITDQELLYAMTYKSNRNYTLPPLSVSLGTAPKYPLSNSQALGLCESGKTYYVSYIVNSNSVYNSGITFGYPQSLHCGYVQKIKGEFDSNGNKTYINASFPSNSFPYLRSSLNMESSSTYSGTGWNANKIQILVNVVNDTDLYNYNTIPSDGWKLISNGIGNGIYTGDTNDLTIDPLKLQGYQFVISEADYNSGTTYNLDNVFTNNADYLYNTGLTFGNESFFFGIVNTNILAYSFKSSIVVIADGSSFNTTVNPTFDPNFNDNVYITEIGIFNTANQLVGVGKPTYPIRKSNSRFLSFKLEYDF